MQTGLELNIQIPRAGRTDHREILRVAAAGGFPVDDIGFGGDGGRADCLQPGVAAVIPVGDLRGFDGHALAGGGQALVKQHRNGAGRVAPDRERPGKRMGLRVVRQGDLHTARPDGKGVVIPQAADVQVAAIHFQGDGDRDRVCRTVCEGDRQVESRAGFYRSVVCQAVAGKLQLYNYIFHGQRRRRIRGRGLRGGGPGHSCAFLGHSRALLGFGRALLRLGRTLLRLGRTLLRLSRTLLGFGRALLGFGRTLLRLGRTLLGFGRALLGLGRTLLRFGRALLGFGRALRGGAFRRGGFALRRALAIALLRQGHLRRSGRFLRKGGRRHHTGTQCQRAEQRCRALEPFFPKMHGQIPPSWWVLCSCCVWVVPGQGRGGNKVQAPASQPAVVCSACSSWS